MFRENAEIAIAGLREHLPYRLQALSVALQAEIGIRQFGQGFILVGKGLQGVQAENGRTQPTGIYQEA